LGSEPDTGFTAVRGNSIVEQDADLVDVCGDRDRWQGFVRSNSRLDCHDISCRRTIFSVGADRPVENFCGPLRVSLPRSRSPMSINSPDCNEKNTEGRAAAP
jgi:hypothetical protein